MALSNVKDSVLAEYFNNVLMSFHITYWTQSLPVTDVFVLFLICGHILNTNHFASQLGLQKAGREVIFSIVIILLAKPFSSWKQDLKHLLHFSY